MTRYTLPATTALIVAAMLAGSSCKKDDNAAPDRRAQLLGRWLCVSGAVDSNDNGTIEASERHALDSAASFTISFNADNTGTSEEGTITFPFFWELINNNADLRLRSNSQAGTIVPYLHLESLSERQLSLLDTSVAHDIYQDFRKL